ncbi:hypothetical protein ACE1CD_15675 [Aerosakkonema sp. BLCC-F183]|uniref:hypothetical protein n=1 Tax=Aerosakkonema sp. BLCC-F183 TaxID=3342834 RepID=UPI0035B8E823
MSELKYYGYSITVIPQPDGTYSFTIENCFQSKHQVDGFSSEDDAFDDACCRIDTILESL